MCDNDCMVATLKQAEEFRGLFLRRGTQLKYKKGEFIIRPGEKPSGVFYIESGLVKAYDITKYGEENTLIIRREEEVFPLIWAITGQERHVMYEALVPTVVRHLTRDVFLKFLQEHPETMRPLLDMVVEMYRVHSERILGLSYRNVRERLVAFLLATAQRFGTKTEDGNILLDVPLRQQDIASCITTTRETAGREIALLEQKGWLTSRNFYITLTDVKALRHYLE